MSRSRSHRRLSSGTAMVTALCCVANVFAEDWPGLRGPRHTGVSTETGLAEQWPNGGPPLLWSRELGQGYSSFAVVEDRAYTQYQGVFGQFVVCLDGRTGATIWETRYEAPYEAMGIYPGPRGTPAIVGDRLYFTSPDGLVGCLRVGDGDWLWSVNVNEKFGGRGTDFGYSCSPLVLDGKVILPVGGENAAMVALDAETGVTVWTGGSDSASYCTAVPITLGGRTLVVGYLENVLGLYELETGRNVWRLNLSSGYDEHAAAPIYREPRLLISGPFQAGADVYRLSWNETVDPPVVHGELEWQSDEFSNDVVSSLELDGAVYGFDLRDPQSKAHRPSRGTFRCLDLETGATLWSSSKVGQASMIAADSRVLLFNDAGDVILSRLSPEGFDELARVTLFADEVCWTPAALSNGRLYLRTQSRAACLYVGLPEQLPQAASVPPATAAEIARSPRWQLAWLIGGEREHPFMRPELAELQRWYVACLVAAALPIGLLLLIPPRSPRRLTWIVAAFGLMLILGIVSTPVLNANQSEFLFTWPLALYAGLQLTLVTIVWAESQTERRRARWRSRPAVGLLLMLGAAYFVVLRRLSLPHEWVFLLGYLPAFPFVAIAARLLVRPSSRLVTALCPVIAFSAYFWLSAAALWARGLWGS